MPIWRIAWEKNARNYNWEVCRSGIDNSCGEEFAQTKATTVDECHNNPIAGGTSLRDVLVLGFPKLLAGGIDENVGPPMFRTGLGKPVAIKETSVVRAKAVLDFDDGLDRVGCPELAVNYSVENVASPIFKTGLGTPVAIKQTSLLRAMAVLGSDDFDGVGHIHSKGGDLGFSNDPFGAKSEEMMINLPLTGFIKPDKLSNFEEIGSTHGCSRRSEQIINPSTNRACEPSMLPNSSHLASVYTPGSVLGHSENNKTTFYGKQSVQTQAPDIKTSAPSPIKFQTAGGRSILVSSDALQRAISLLGDPELGSFLDNDDDIENPLLSSPKQGKLNDCSPDRNADITTYPEHAEAYQVCDRNKEMEHSLEHTSSGITQQSFVGPTVEAAFCDKKHMFYEKRAHGKHSITPFKRPRSSLFSISSNTTRNVASDEIEGFDSKRRVSSRYPFKAKRIYFKEFFGTPSFSTGVDLPEEIRLMSPHTTDTYLFRDGLHPDCVGVKDISDLLVSSVGSTKYASIEWVVNHYRWIVWKFASYERCYIGKCKGKILTLNNVLEELKYRYEREVNFGHKSSIKKILEGILPPSSMMVLCISSVGSAASLPKPKSVSGESVEATNDNFLNIELTDGWYSISAHLDKLLSMKLAAGKLYVGQKLRIWGAKLSGWVEPVSPLEVPQESRLVLHMNGTYRAHWADLLGECKTMGPPLALTCIKKAGGCVPQTLLGLTRIYPVLFKEKLNGGVSAVRSQRSENRIMKLFEERCCNVMEDIVSGFEKDDKVFPNTSVSDSEEGAEILNMLERSAEPEVLMADMSIDQLTSLATYKKKLETERQLEMEKSIEKALDSAGISTRDVSSFMRLKVVALSSIQHEKIGDYNEAIVTIWNPTEIQQSELMEGHAYVVTELEPLNFDSHDLHLRARGPNSMWNSLSRSEIEYFKPFFSPRKSISISNFGEVPLWGEFDTAVLIVYVGEVHGESLKGKQWVFVTDDSVCCSDVENLSYALLAISFYVPHVDDSFAPFSHDLVGSIVGFCNLTKREKDRVNNIWIAEATQNSAYFTNCDSPHCSHLKEASISVQKWLSFSSPTIEKLQRRVLSFFGDSLELKNTRNI